MLSVKNNMAIMTMTNYNDPRNMAETLSEITERIIPIEQIERLTEKQRRFLIVLILKWTYGEKINGQEPIEIIKDILKIRPYLNKPQTYLKIKYNKDEKITRVSKES